MGEPKIGNVLGEGRVAVVRDYGELVLKTYKSPLFKASAFREAAALAIVERLDIPAPRVREVRQIDGLWSLVMTRAPGTTFGQTIRAEPGRTDEYLADMARLHWQMHGHFGCGLPSLKARLRSNIENASVLNDMQKRNLLIRLAPMADGDRVCHGDFHPWNVIGTPPEATVIDWLDACCGSPAADVCRSFVLLHPVMPDMAKAYVALWSEVSRESSDAVFAWLPFVAAARLAEGVADENAGLLRHVLG